MTATLSPPELIEKLTANITSVYQGRDKIVKLCLVALLSRGHLLLEDVPGVGKTTLASVLAQSIDCQFQRIQFTSDLLPSDILGVNIFNQQTQGFDFKRGPIFANVVLGDEINRTTPKTQSALLEAMSSAHVSMDGISHQLPEPFIVLATQNPTEFHGTFPLPKSQMDRFVMRLHLGYPDAEGEMQVLRDQGLAMRDLDIKPVVHKDDIMNLQKASNDVRIDDALLDYIVRIGKATREHPQVELGISTRGLLALRRCAQAWALIEGRDYVVPDDIKAVAVPVIAHRLQVVRTFDQNSLSQHDDEILVEEILNNVSVPL